jgi:hypothetical protein
MAEIVHGLLFINDDVGGLVVLIPIYQEYDINQLAFFTSRDFHFLGRAGKKVVRTIVAQTSDQDP